MPTGSCPVAGPRKQGEIAINRSAAEKNGLEVRSKTKVVVGQGSTEPMDVTVVALIDQPGATSGFVNIWFDEQTARERMTDGTYVGFAELGCCSRGVAAATAGQGGGDLGSRTVPGAHR